MVWVSGLEASWAGGAGASWAGGSQGRPPGEGPARRERGPGCCWGRALGARPLLLLQGHLRDAVGELWGLEASCAGAACPRPAGGPGAGLLGGGGPPCARPPLLLGVCAWLTSSPIVAGVHACSCGGVGPGEQAAQAPPARWAHVRRHTGGGGAGQTASSGQYHASIKPSNRSGAVWVPSQSR